ncbi:MAG: phage major tail tube protein [Phenylobacterium sp.]|nr:phage major tail tube protein [Phenylobacterium sp.]
MASAFYIMEAVNLFAGDHDPSNSKHLTLDEFKLPDLQEMFQDHAPGGAPVQVEIGTGMIQKLEPTFKLKGFDPDLLAQFGLGSNKLTRFTGYGVMRNARTGEGVQSIATIQGRLGRVAPDAQKRGELNGHEYTINQVMSYELEFAGRELFAWDFFTNKLRVNGVDQNAESNRLLGIS